MVPVWLRRATFVVAAIAAAGIAEQSADPSPVLSALVGAEWPGSGWWSIWVLWNLVASVLCVAALFCWPRRMLVVRTAAVVLAGAIWARSVALWIEYGADLWGTVARNVLTALLIVGSWAWSGSTLRRLDP